MEIIVEEEVREEGSTLVTRLIRSGISPFASECLDETFSLTVCLRAVRSGKVVADVEFEASGGEVFGAVGGAAIGEDAFDGDAMAGVEVDGLVEGIEDAGFFSSGRRQAKGKSGVIIDGDEDAFPVTTATPNS